MKRVYLASASLLSASLALSSPGIAGDKAAVKTDEWRTYGPIRLDWAGWNKMGESYVTRGMNSKEGHFWLSVSCEKLKINVTGKDGKWMSWLKPKAIFEYGFVGNLCSSKGYDISALSKDSSRGTVIIGGASSNNNSWQGYYNYKSYLDNYNNQQQKLQQKLQQQQQQTNRFYDQVDRVIQQGRSYSPTPTYSAPSNSTPYVSPFQRY